MYLQHASLLPETMISAASTYLYDLMLVDNVVTLSSVLSAFLCSSEHVALQGAQAHAAGVLFPSDDEVLQRTILIANINPLINTEQVCCSQADNVTHLASCVNLTVSFQLLTVLSLCRSSNSLGSVAKSRAAVWWATTSLRLLSTLLRG